MTDTKRSDASATHRLARVVGPSSSGFRVPAGAVGKILRFAEPDYRLIRLVG